MDLHDYTAAGRLYKFFSFMLDLEDQGVPAFDTWLDYFGAESAADPIYFDSVGALIRLPYQARVEVAESANSMAISRLNRALPQVDATLALAPTIVNFTVHEFQGYFDVGVVRDLETSSEVLAERLMLRGSAGDDESGAEDDVDRITRLATELLDVVAKSDLPPEVAMLLANNAEALLHAILMLKIAGPEGVVQEYHRFVGALTVAPVAQSEISKRPPVAGKFTELLKTLVLFGQSSSVPGQVAISAADAYTAVEPIVKAITGH